MFGEERKLKILKYIQKNTRASVQELSQYLAVSEATIRRDLKELEKARLINRTHGGAMALHGVNFELTFREKEDKFKQEKEAIAQKALEFIEEGDTIILDSGTTVFQLAQRLKNFARLTVVTNSLIIAQELQLTSGIEVHLTGGILRRETLALVGPIAEESLEQIRVDKAFIATNGIDLKEGLTTPTLAEAAVKRKMIKAAKEVFLLADHSKAGKVTFARFAKITDLNHFITDSGISKNFAMELGKLGVQVTIAEV
ncbi:DeoR/GlpR family DNA-binding transcription regulator [Carboxydothermus pertinax]|uniref:DeoR family transcriptional regulator n=1 Tax=Carboxydothermus pertinax TaxID=870242 RepID=A0A1L8CUA9_9THEO|nr:DeoR/GlpR family DNA-binding transcription regulator [Carboxydothermus pertinax]GAV22454.1 DeoR family transcriptional regulator [Carboxydothermus pertinax]